MKHLAFPVLLAAAAVLAMPALVVVGCGAGDGTAATTTLATAAAPTALGFYRHLGYEVTGTVDIEGFELYCMFESKSRRVDG